MRLAARSGGPQKSAPWIMGSMDRFRIRHRPFSLTVGTRLHAPQPTFEAALKQATGLAEADIRTRSLEAK